jgi:putative tryptophan/tyrosine transport system substrate-binding protein
MNRRSVMASVAGLIFSARLAEAAGKPKRRLAMLSIGPATAPIVGALFNAFWEGMRALGYSPDDFEFSVRVGDGLVESLPPLATELARLTPEVIVAGGPPAVAAARKAMPAIPIVMVDIADPVGLGFVASLAHPGGNITGLANFAQELAGKRVELLKAVSPSSAAIAFLFNPGNPGNLNQLRGAENAAKALRIDVVAVEVRASDEIERAFDAIGREHADALVVADEPVFNGVPGEVALLAARRKIPAVYAGRPFVVAGGLISYGVDKPGLFRQAASYVDKLLKGAKPADLPVEQPTKFEFVINLKTAKALGLTVPQSLLARANEVIE